jgi:hypothetical protein
MLRQFCLACVLTFPAGAQVTAKRPAFSDFAVKEVFRGTPVSPRLLTKGQRMFRTRIRDGAKGPVEFAGHYTLPRWGCGAGCSEFALVDSVTGRVYVVPFSLEDLPFSWLDEHGGDEAHKRMDYRPDSRLMKIDGCLNEVGCGFYDYVMVDDKGLKLVRKELLPPKFRPKQ